MASKRPKMQPSKPRPIGESKPDMIKVQWEPPTEQLDPPIFYEVRYKLLTGKEKSSDWIRHKDCLKDCFFKLENLPSGSKYIFQVRMANEDEVGPYSEQSDIIVTVESEARRFCSGLFDVVKENVEIPVKRVPFVEDKTFRNEQAKTRKFVYGKSKLAVKEKTIMILGPTGAGKSTLVDGMINYIFGVSWRDNFRLTVENIEAEEKAAKGNQAMSQTVWITCYTIQPMKGLRIPYKLTIIDTPGYGDVRGIEADKGITEQIRQLFTDTNGILSLDALCFVIKASDARLTKTQEYIFNSILSIFQKDIIENFCMMVTFADGKRPEVLSALKAANLPHEQYFSFNNSALFAKNDSGDSVDISRSVLDWNMGRKGFDEFFEALEKLRSKSLALSQEVLNERKRIQITLENVQMKLDAALIMSESLNELVKKMKESGAKAEENKDYTYTVSEITCNRETSENSNLNCKNCTSTCHKSCWAWNVNWCISMCDVFQNGKCSQCEKRCTAEYHINEKYFYRYITVTETKTYENIKEKYEAAAKQTLSHQGLIEEMQNKLQDINEEIKTMIDEIEESNARLQEIALRDDPLSMEDQFDMWIQEEETNRTEGWKERVKSYTKFKKHAGIQKAAKETQKKIDQSVAEAKEVGRVTKFFSRFLPFK